jgi:hypothetical protein
MFIKISLNYLCRQEGVYFKVEMGKVVSEMGEVVPEMSKVVPEMGKVVPDTIKVVPEMGKVVPSGPGPFSFEWDRHQKFFLNETET